MLDNVSHYHSLSGFEINHLTGLCTIFLKRCKPTACLESFACPPDLQKNGRRVEVSAAVEQISCFATSSTVAVTLSVLARLRCLYKGILQPQGWRVWSGSCVVVCIFSSYIYRISTILSTNSQVLPTKS